MTCITGKIKIVDLALYVEERGLLVLSDFHIGYEEALQSRALLPRFQFNDTLTRLDGIFAKLKDKKISTIILNGDLKHEFGTISSQEWRDVLRLLDYLRQRCERIVIVKGNHDVQLGPIARKRDVEVVVYYRVGEILVAHGDEIMPAERTKSVKTIIIGHEHPALAVRDGRRVEMVKCFLKGKWKRKTLIVQPSFNLVVEGTDVLHGEFLSPYLQDGIESFDIYAVPRQGEVLYFGRIGNL